MRKIGIYIHIPFCVRKCNYCDFPSVAGRLDLLPAYLEAVEAELAMAARRYAACEAVTVFVGGGTPSLLPPDGYARLMGAVRAAFPVAPDAEISLEVNPGTITPEKAQAMAAAGFNRASVGVQAAQDELLRAMGRIHRRRDAEAAVRNLWDAGIRNLNLDLMFGLPGQTEAMWRESLGFALDMPISHLSFYSLSVEEGTPWGEQQAAHRLALPSDAADRRMYHLARAMLRQSGFVHYEISNAAKPGLSCRHNLIYWNRGEYLGIGAGAHSLMDGWRFANVSDPEAYIQSVRMGEAERTERFQPGPEEILSERMFMGLRLLEGIDLGTVSGETAIDVEGRFAQDIGRLADEGLLVREGARIRLSVKGLDLANRVFLAFI